MADDAVLFEVPDHVAKVTLNRPEAMNAINRDVSHGLIASPARACRRSSTPESEIPRGFFPGGGGPQRLPRMIPQGGVERI
ncbi:MAG: hypothetical protein V3V67_00205 [Myxococcota bacterium]